MLKWFGIIYLSIGFVVELIAMLLIAGDTLYGTGSKFELKRWAAIFFCAIVIVGIWPVFVGSLVDEIKQWQKKRLASKES